MNTERSALRVAAWLVLVYAALGGFVCVFLWFPTMFQGEPLRIDWSLVPYHVGIPLFISESHLWLPVGVFLNAIAAVAFINEASGRSAARMFRFYGGSIITLVLFELGLTTYLILISPIRISSNTSICMFWHEITPWLVAGPMLCLPLLARLGIFLLWGRRHTDGTDFCTTCGYNLTGNVSGICPECGERICV